MTGRITMRGRARWAGPGGSSRPVPRLFSQARPGAVLWGCCCRQHGPRAEHLYLLAGDAVGGTQAGQHTYGLDRCGASLDGKPGPGWSVFALSRVRVQERRSFPSRVEQGVRSAAETAASQAKVRAKTPQPATAKCRLGRPQGRQNNAQADGTLTPEL
jgi:putative transposase